MLRCSHKQVMVMERVSWSFQPSVHCGSTGGAGLSARVRLCDVLNAGFCLGSVCAAGTWLH